MGWRQNEQTFQAATVGISPVTHLNLYYGYVWNVHRVFGNVDNLSAANQNFDSSSHLINVCYDGWKYGSYVAYSYLLDLSNAAGHNSSCATYGGYFAGQAPISEKWTVDYRAEHAFQTQYAESALNYNANYYGLSRIDMGVGDLIVPLLIATAEMLLVILYFMRARFSEHLIWVIAGGGFLWLANFVDLMLSDYLTRGTAWPLR